MQWPVLLAHTCEPENNVDCAVEIISALKSELTPASMQQGSQHTIEIKNDDSSIAEGNTDDLGNDVECERAASSIIEEAQSAAQDGSSKHWLLSGELSGKLEYRWSQVNNHADANAAMDSGQDVALYIGYTMTPQESWKLHIALGSSRLRHPTSVWVPVDTIGTMDNFSIVECWGMYDYQLGGDQFISWQAGRYPYPFSHSQLVYDNDLVLTATHLQYTDDRQRGSLDRWRLSVLAAKLRGCGGGIIETGNYNDDEGGLTLLPDDGRAGLVSTRLGGRWDLNEQQRLEAALSYHDFTNANSIGAAVATGQWHIGGPAGLGETTNYTLGNGLLISDFNILDLWARATWRRRTPWPVSIETECVHNYGSKGDAANSSNAYFAELSVGTANVPGTWQFELEHATIEVDAALAAVNRGTYATGSKVSGLHGRYCPADSIEVQCSYYWKSAWAPISGAPSFDEEEIKISLSYTW